MKVKRVKWFEQIGVNELNKFKEEQVTEIVLESTGTDNINLKLAKEMGFNVYSLPNYSNASVAQWALEGLLFPLLKKQGRRMELKHKLAVVIGGAGAIGKELCSILKGFGCLVLDYDMKSPGYREEMLFRWLAEADLIFFTVPLNDETRDYFNWGHYACMERKPIIINASGRVDLMNENLLEYVLSFEIVSGYACDGLTRHNISSRPDVYYCEHQGAQTPEAQERKNFYLDNLLRELKNIR